MSNSIKDQTLALAGIMQAATQVDQIARHGATDQMAFETSLQSLFVRDPDTAEDVFGGAHRLRLGLRCLTEQLGGDLQQRNVEVTRYVMALLHLERKLSKQRHMLDVISQGLDSSLRQIQHFDLTHPAVIGRLADIYSETISTLTPRIMVRGEHEYLNVTENANKIRALLLAGVRSAVLWSQSGGGRLKLMLRRKAYLEEAQHLLASTR